MTPFQSGFIFEALPGCCQSWSFVPRSASVWRHHSVIPVRDGFFFSFLSIFFFFFFLKVGHWCGFFFSFFFPSTRRRAAPGGSSSVVQDDLDETGHVRLFGVVQGKKGMLLRQRREGFFCLFFCGGLQQNRARR